MLKIVTDAVLEMYFPLTLDPKDVQAMQMKYWVIGVIKGLTTAMNSRQQCSGNSTSRIFKLIGSGCTADRQHLFGYDVIGKQKQGSVGVDRSAF